MEFMVGELGDGLQHQEMLYNDHKRENLTFYQQNSNVLEHHKTNPYIISIYDYMK
jgi:hypothetical protein